MQAFTVPVRSAFILHSNYKLTKQFPLSTGEKFKSVQTKADLTIAAEDLRSLIESLNFDYKRDFYRSYLIDGEKRYSPQIRQGKSYGDELDPLVINPKFTKRQWLRITTEDLVKHIKYSNISVMRKMSKAVSNLLIPEEDKKNLARYMTSESRILGSVRKVSNIFIIDGDNKRDLSPIEGLKTLSKAIKLVQDRFKITPLLTEASNRGSFHLFYNCDINPQHVLKYLQEEIITDIKIELGNPNRNFRFPLSHDYFPLKYDKILLCDQSDFYDLNTATYDSFNDFFQNIDTSEQVAENIISNPEPVIEPVLQEEPVYIWPTLKSTSSCRKTKSIQDIIDDESLNIVQGNRYNTEAKLFAYARHSGITDHNEIIQLCYKKLKSSKDVESKGYAWWNNHLTKAFQKLEAGFVPSLRKTDSEFVSSLHILSEEESKDMDCFIREYLGKQKLEEVPEIALVLKECLCKIIYDAQNRKSVNDRFKRFYNDLMLEGLSKLPDLPCNYFDRMRIHYKLGRKGYSYRNMILEPAKHMEDKVPFTLGLFTRYSITENKKTWIRTDNWGYTQRLESIFTFDKGESISQCFQKVKSKLLGLVYNRARELQQVVLASYSVIKNKSLIYIPARECISGEEIALQDISEAYFDPVPDG